MSAALRLMNLIIVTTLLAGAWTASGAGEPESAARVDLRWGVRIPLRDGVELNATVYLPGNQPAPAPCIFTLTPYIAETYHERGIYFAAHGYPFLTVDVRGRGNSEGQFHPLIQEARDGYDVVEWLARQPYCNSKVAMWGGSYAGYDQWVTAKEFPPHLTTIVPVASPYPGLDFPMVLNIFAPYDVQWLTYTGGRTSQAILHGDQSFWASRFRSWQESGAEFRNLDARIGNPSPIFQEWVQHPYPDAYWDAYNPTSQDYAKLALPILTITGSHDDDQLGALTHYRNFMANATQEARARHFLVIGPWDHMGTRTPRKSFGGLTLGSRSLLDIPKLHLEWYAWTMQGGPKPEFLQRLVVYYVIGADHWRYSDSLDGITGERRTLYLDSTGSADDMLHSGTLKTTPGKGLPDTYIHDPRDVSTAALESTVDPASLVDQSMVSAQQNKELVYHSDLFPQDTEVSGFFKLSAFITINQPDTDFAVSLYEVRADGTAILLTSDRMRARYRESLRNPKLIATKSPLRYDFEHFPFVSQEVKQGSRLRLVITPVNSIYSEKNYNGPGAVANESVHDARTVTVTLLHDREHPSALIVPLGREVETNEPVPPELMFTGIDRP